MDYKTIYASTVQDFIELCDKMSDSGYMPHGAIITVTLNMEGEEPFPVQYIMQQWVIDLDNQPWKPQQ